MSYTDIIKERIRKNRKILVEPTDSLLIPLNKRFELASHKDNIRFVFKVLLGIIENLKEALPKIDWMEEPYFKAKSWASGTVKMTTVKPMILKLHQLAKETPDDAVSALLHAYGQGLSVIHTKKHAMGLPIYELTALLLRSTPIDYEFVLQKRVLYYHQILDEIETEMDDKTWASFIEK